MNKESLTFGGLYALAAALVIGLLVLLFFTIRADGAVTYCYIESASNEGVPRAFYKLEGYRPWRPDNRLGIFENFQDAVNAANLAQCPLKK